MARGSVSIVNVREAREELIAKGLRPHVRAIQEITGGSNTTIIRHLRELESLNYGTFGRGGFVDVELTSCVERLHDRLQEMAVGEITAAKEDARQQITDAQALLDQERKERLALQRSLDTREEELARASTEAASLSEKLVAANQELAVQAQKLSDNAEQLKRQHDQIDALERRLADREQKNLDFITETANQRKESEARHQADKALLGQQRDRLQNEVIALSRDNASLVQRNSDLAKDVAERDRRIEALGNEVRSGQAELTAAIAQSAAQGARIESLVEKLQSSAPARKKPRRQPPN